MTDDYCSSTVVSELTVKDFTTYFCNTYATWYMSLDVTIIAEKCNKFLPRHYSTTFEPR